MLRVCVSVFIILGFGVRKYVLHTVQKTAKHIFNVTYVEQKNECAQGYVR